jgi:hypothetical protein
MKKILCCSLLVLLFVQISSLNLRVNEEISFSSSTETNEKPSVMENIFNSKSVGVTTNPARFKETATSNGMESPVIVSRNFQDITSRVAGSTSQSISNSAAFDVVHRSPQDYYDNRRFFVFDKNFNQMENYMIDGFKKQIDANINYDANEEHSSGFEKRKLNVNTNDAPYVSKFVKIRLLGEESNLLFLNKGTPVTPKLRSLPQIPELQFMEINK